MALPGCLGLLTAAGAAPAAYPDKPLRLVVPYVAGSPADAVARVLGDGLARRLGQSVVVDNKPGGNAQIGSEAVAQAAPDGYTLMLGNMDSHALNPLVFSKLRYQPERDFTSIVLVGTQSLVLVAGPAAPFKNSRELIAAAKREPGRFAFGTWGLGSVAHLWMAALEQAAGIELNHIPFQGTPVALNALLGDQIALMFLPPPLAVDSARAGKLAVIGTTAARRLPGYPDVPTLAEQGFGGFEGATWFAVFAPAGLPVEVQALLNRELNAVLSQPEVTAKLASVTMTVVGGEPAVLARTMTASRAALAAVMAQRKIPPLD